MAIRRALRLRPAGDRRRRRRFSGTARRHSGGAGPGRGEPARSVVVLSAAADCPFLPRDLVSRLQARCRGEAELAVAASDGQSHPVIGLWSVSLREQLRHALVVEDVRKIDRWTARYRLATVTWPTEPLDPFFNANTMDESRKPNGWRRWTTGELSNPREPRPQKTQLNSLRILQTAHASSRSRRGRAGLRLR